MTQIGEDCCIALELLLRVCGGEMNGDGTNISNGDTTYRELIVYACPTGELAASLEDYFAAAAYRCGSNTAHEDIPHCTLTGFFHDDYSSISDYVDALETAVRLQGQSKPDLPISITGLRFEPKFHYLAIQSPWLESVAETFAELANSSTRIDALRLKTNLHVSLAYGFEPEQQQQLRNVAEELNWQVPVGWEVRIYERHPRLPGSCDESRMEAWNCYWTCHGCWEV